MKSALAPIAALLTGVAILLVGTGTLNTLVILRGSFEGFAGLQIGALTSCYFLGFLAGTFISPGLTQRAGYIRTFAFCGALLGISILASALWINFWFWCAMRFVTGIALVTQYGLIESWLNGQTPTEKRGSVFGVYMVVNLVALALAQQAFNFVSVETGTLFLFSALMINLALLPVTMTRLPQPASDTRSPPAVGRAFILAPLAIFTAGLSGLAMGAYWGLMPLYAIDTIGENRVGLFMSVAILGGAFFQIPIGRLSDRYDRRRILLAVTCSAFGIALLMLIAGYFFLEDWWLLLILGFLYSGFIFCLYPLGLAHLVD